MNFRVRKRFMGGGPSSILRRVREILTAYGVSERKFADKLAKYAGILKVYGTNASFSATAIAVARNPHLFKGLEKDGVELVIQGFRHIDYSTTAPEKQEEDVRAAVDVFGRFGLTFSGFRAPYLKLSPETRSILKNYVTYDSSEKFLWDCQLPIACQNRSEGNISAPIVRDGLLEIPVSLPSDVWLLHRLGVQNQNDIYDLWKNTFESSHERGELFTLQLHPENIDRCDEALKKLLACAREKKPPVWMTTLGEVASWWAQRSKCTLSRSGGRNHKITLEGSERATLLTRNLDVPGARAWFGGCDVVEGREFSAAKNPAVGVSPNASSTLAQFLKDEGFIVEESTRRKTYGLYFDREQFGERDQLALLSEIEASGKPYVRLWRWPERARSALSISGDIDCVTLWDYAYRLVGE